LSKFWKLYGGVETFNGVANIRLAQVFTPPQAALGKEVKK